MKAKIFSKALFTILLLGTLLVSSSVITAIENEKTTELNAVVNEINRVVVFSIDAFRYDYFPKVDDEFVFQWFMEEGIVADYQVSSNPTVTAVNHVSMITGNHVDEHGIIGNTFYDWADNYSYSLFSDAADPYRNTNTGLHLLTSKPSVIHAEENAVNTAVFAWPYVDEGTDYGGISPTYLYDYDWFGAQDKRTDFGIANTVAQTIVSHPDIELAYAWLPGVDAAGHYSGVDSSTLEAVLHSINTALDKFFSVLEKNDLLKDTVVILTSDHGMATVTDSYYFLEDKQFYLDAVGNTSLTPYIAHDAAFELLYFMDETNTSKVEEFASYLKGAPGIQTVYVNEENDAINLNHPDRGVNISVWLDQGMSRHFGSPYVGMHGYLNDNPEMRGIFMIAGPGITQNSTIGATSIRDIAPTTLALLGIESGFVCGGTALTSVEGTRTSNFTYPFYVPSTETPTPTPTPTDEGSYAFLSLLTFFVAGMYFINRRRKN